MKLSNELRNKTLKIEKLNFKDQHILHKLNNIGICENSVIKVLDYEDNKKLIHLLVYGVQYVLREQDCRNIDVQEVI